MPVYWVEQKFTIDDEKTEMLKDALAIPWYANMCGVFLVFLGTIILVWQCYSRRQRKDCKIGKTEDKMKI